MAASLAANCLVLKCGFSGAVKKSPHPAPSWVTDRAHSTALIKGLWVILRHDTTCSQTHFQILIQLVRFNFRFYGVEHRLLLVDLLMCVLWVRYIIYLNSFIYWINIYWVPTGFHGGSAGKGSTCNVGDLGSIPGLGRSPGEGNGYPLQYSGLENSMDCIVHGVTKSWTQLSDFHLLNLVYNPCCC